VPTDNRFTGQKEDGTGLVYMNARYYDPVTGQFVSPDTLVPDATNLFDYNRYMYVRGNPLKYSEDGKYAGNSGWYDILRAAQDGDRVTAIYADQSATLQGTFQRSKEGRISINMKGQTIDDYGFARFGGYVPGAKEAGLPSDYGMYHLEGKYGQVWATAASGRQAFGDMPCGIWDCVAIGLDITSLGATIFRDSSLLSTPLTGPMGVMGATHGEAIANTADLAGLTRSFQQRAIGRASDIDLAVGLVAYGIGRIPGAGIVAGFAQLSYDLSSPLHPW
jgi:RHS repeat-associated protein